MACPFCAHEEWHGWDERVTLEHVFGSDTIDRRAEAFPLTCSNCGFIRLQSARVLDDPRSPTADPRPRETSALSDSRRRLRPRLDTRVLPLRRPDPRRGEAGGYTALYYSLRAAASALAVPAAGLTIAASGSYRSSSCSAVRQLSPPSSHSSSRRAQSTERD